MQKLELTWIGKGEQINPEPRILIEKPEYSYGEANTSNMLIHGDNLLALKALELDYAGKVKCVYIDPPYNTGAAFEHYDDNLEHSTWLNLMKPRLEILRNLLAENGSIYVQIDESELGYLCLLLDEIFGRNNRINIITVKTKIAGVSGSYAGRSLQNTSEYILAYSKDKTVFEFCNKVSKKQELMSFIKTMEAEGKSWKYTSVLKHLGEGEYIKTIYDGSGDEIKLYKHNDFKIMSINEIAKIEFGGDLKKAYYRYIDNIFQTTNAQSSIRTRIMEATADETAELVGAKYVPKSGKNKNTEVTLLYKGVASKRLFAWLKDVVTVNDNEIYKTETVGTIWDDMQYNNLTKEGNVQFPNGKKPEMLVQRIIELATNPSDLVLDSFLGSGTTAAVALKMGRKFIGIEFNGTAYTHCYPRLKAVVDGEQGGISKVVNWQGGGGFKFYELAPTLLETDERGVLEISGKYNEEMLAQAMAKHEGYTYAPNENTLWKQGYSGESNFIFTTTGYISPKYLDNIASQLGEGEYLLICAESFDKACIGRHKNITVSPIPKMLLGRCEWGKDNYDLNILLEDSQNWADEEYRGEDNGK